MADKMQFGGLEITKFDIPGTGMVLQYFPEPVNLNTAKEQEITARFDKTLKVGKAIVDHLLGKA